MAKYTFDNTSEKRFTVICLNASSMAQAALQLEMNYKTVRFHAKRLGCFKTNQAGKNRQKRHNGKTVSLDAIFNGTNLSDLSKPYAKVPVAEGRLQETSM